MTATIDEAKLAIFLSIVLKLRQFRTVQFLLFCKIRQYQKILIKLRLKMLEKPNKAGLHLKN